MATKSITITVEAYERLASLKESRESFSDVINRVAPKKRPSLFGLVGILSNKESDEIRRNIADTRKRMDDEIEKRISRLK